MWKKDWEVFMSKKIHISYLGKFEKFKILKGFLKDYINIGAIFSDETENFVNPAEPKSDDNITIKFRTGKSNIDKVFINFGNETLPLEFDYSDDVFDFYKITLSPIKSPLRYYFSLAKDNKVYYYNKKGLYENVDINYNFTIIPDFEVPAWSKGSVMYQIYVDRFYNGDLTNDVCDKEYLYMGRISKKMKDWNVPVEADDICNFYGGDLQGVIDKMGYLKDLGIDAIYFNPIFVSPSNHKYDTQDYDYVDPHIGVIIKDNEAPLTDDKLINRHANMYIERTTSTENLEASNQLMQKVIEIAHAHNIKIILDGVFNHCGAFNKWLDKEGFYFNSGYPAGAYRAENSIYHDYFKWYEHAWPNNDCYDSWWGHDNHPKLYFENSKALRDYIINIGVKWVSPPYNADGWRLDVAADLGDTEEFNHKFWKEFREAVKKANPQAIILAEHYGDPRAWLSGSEWDTVMNYDAFMEPITWFLTGMQKHSESYKEDMFCNAMAFEQSMRYYQSKFSYQSLYSSMNQLSNHDHSRFLTRTNKTAGRLHTLGSIEADRNINLSIMMEAVTFQMTWAGAPTIYYGDEVGLTGWTDPDNRRTFPWGKENTTLLEFHKKAIDTRKKSNALLKGSTVFIYSSYGVLCYGRWFEDEAVIVILNNRSEIITLSLPVWKAHVKPVSILHQQYSTVDERFSDKNDKYYVKDGLLLINLPPTSSIVLSNKEYD